MKNKLVMGCGENYHGEEWEHLDIVNTEAVNTIHDLRTGHLPYPDDRFEVVMARNVLEHLPDKDYLDIIEEIIRVSRPGATVIISGPHYLSWNSAASDHYRAFSKISMNVFKIDHEYPTPATQAFEKVEVGYKLNEGKWVRRLNRIIPERLLRKHVPNAIEEVIFKIKIAEEDF